MKTSVMKKRKKKMSRTNLVGILAMVFSLAACGGSSKPASTTPANDESEWNTESDDGELGSNGDGSDDDSGDDSSDDTDDSYDDSDGDDSYDSDEDDSYEDSDDGDYSEDDE